MSTNCLIGVIKDNDSKKGRCIYCHWDGYPEYVGAILLAHYKNLSKVEKLLALGDISSLGEKVIPAKKFEDTHSFKTPAPYTTLAYYRDRDNKGSLMNNQKKNSAEIYNFRDPYCIGGSNIEWVYLFDPHTLMWYIYKVMDGGDNYARVWLEERLINRNYLIKEAIKNGYMTKPKN